LNHIFVHQPLDPSDVDFLQEGPIRLDWLCVFHPDFDTIDIRLKYIEYNLLKRDTTRNPKEVQLQNFELVRQVQQPHLKLWMRRRDLAERMWMVVLIPPIQLRHNQEFPYYMFEKKHNAQCDFDQLRILDIDLNTCFSLT
jgi:hypothetical protein